MRFDRIAVNDAEEAEFVTSVGLKEQASQFVTDTFGERSDIRVAVSS